MEGGWSVYDGLDYLETSFKTYFARDFWTFQFRHTISSPRVKAPHVQTLGNETRVWSGDER